MSRDPMNQDEQWEDIVRRLGGSETEAKADPVFEEPSETQPTVSDRSLPMVGPRDYTVAEADDDFRPPEPKPVSTGNPRTLLSWFGVIAAVILWIVTGMVGWHLPWWLTAVSIAAFIAGASSLFFLLPKTQAHRNPFDDDDYGNGARV